MQSHRFDAVIFLAFAYPPFPCTVLRLNSFDSDSRALSDVFKSTAPSSSHHCLQHCISDNNLPKFTRTTRQFVCTPNLLPSLKSRLRGDCSSACDNQPHIHPATVHFVFTCAQRMREKVQKLCLRKIMWITIRYKVTRLCKNVQSKTATYSNNLAMYC